MAPSSKQVLTFGALLALLPAWTAAGSQTTIYACVDYHVKPTKPFEVSFTAGGPGYDACMKRTGTSVTATVKSTGLTCASLGEVESDNEGWCYWKKSYWAVSYSANGIVGSTGSRWEDEMEENSWITLQESSPHTNVCTSKAHCEDTKLRWDYERKPDVYIIFQPGTGFQRVDL